MDGKGKRAVSSGFRVYNVGVREIGRGMRQCRHANILKGTLEQMHKLVRMEQLSGTNPPLRNALAPGKGSDYRQCMANPFPR